MQTKTTEDHLREQIEDLQRQLADHKTTQPRRTSTTTLIVIALLTLVLIVGGFFVGYVPRQRREQVLAAETRESGVSLPAVNVTNVTRSSNKGELVLPGNIQAVTEAPILARSTGYLVKRYVDIGDLVK